METAQAAVTWAESKRPTCHMLSEDSSLRKPTLPLGAQVGLIRVKGFGLGLTHCLVPSRDVGSQSG